MRKVVSVEMVCHYCGTPLVFEPPDKPDMSLLYPRVSVRVQPCMACAEAKATQMFTESGDSWENLNWMSRKGSALDFDA